MNDQIDRIITQYSFTDYKWIVPQKDIIVSRWVRFHCEFGCKNYGKNGSCPPAVPSIEECRKMIYEYENAIIFHFSIYSEDKEEHLKRLLRLYELEREIFLAGYYKVFLLQYSSCILCNDCPTEGAREKCVNKSKSRPGADAMGIDIYQTAHNVGYQVQVVKSHDETTNRFGFLLVN
jgi:predicted metal-binding protein